MVAGCCHGASAVRYFGDLISNVFDRRYSSFLAGQSDDRPINELCEALLGSRGEISGGSLARCVLERYGEMDASEKGAFFHFLCDGLGISPQEVFRALESYQAHPSRSTYKEFSAASEPRRQELIRRLNRIEDATRDLVAMRADLLAMMPNHPRLAPLDVDFKHLFASWFNLGFLMLRPINWNSPAAILEKIIAYEAVHMIESWEDLRRRMQPEDRRCFAFFHPAMGDEPLIFVEVALTKGVPHSIQHLLSDTREELAAHDTDTAVFYSISNCQPGLAGISFGNSLIKQVVADLAREFPQVRQFVTLSPIPGLRAWAEGAGLSLAGDPEEVRSLASCYLTQVKRADGLPLDPVARFHLGNGAYIHAVHAEADTSENGLRQSGGAMVNYCYDLAQIPQNHESFVGQQRVAASKDVVNLAQKTPVQPAGD